MKPKHWILIGSLSLAALLWGCATGAPPTKLESALFNTTTNVVPVIVPAYVTNVTVVNQGVTNIVPVTVPAHTENETNYVNTPKPSVTGVVSAIGGLVPGWGSVASYAIGGILSIWGYLRSSKNANTAAVLAQNVQTARQIIQALPNGAALDANFTQFIQAHQADEGVLTDVMNIIASEVTNRDAQAAAQQITATVSALVSGTAPSSTSTTPKV